MLEDRLNFRFGYDTAAHRGYFENRHPQGREPSVYRTDAHSSYCEIAFLSNLDRTGNVLAIGGTEVEGTEGGGEFVTNPASLARLREMLGLRNDARLPYFDILLESSRVGGVAPRFSIVATRILKP